MNPLARNTDPDTSHAAAERAAAFAGSHESRIIEALRGSFGMTGKDIAHMTGLTDVQVCRRLPFMDEVAVVTEHGEPLKCDGSRVWALAR
jgi:hypothetical protein